MWKRQQTRRRVLEETLDILQRRYKYLPKGVWEGHHRNRRHQNNLYRSHKITSIEALQMYIFAG